MFCQVIKIFQRLLICNCDPLPLIVSFLAVKVKRRVSFSIVSFGLEILNQSILLG